MAISMTASCSYGSVELEIIGPPIATVVCIVTIARKAPDKLKLCRVHLPFAIPMGEPL